MKNAVGLPPFLVIVALLVGAAVGGLTGALLSIPIAAVIVVVLERVQARDAPVALHSVEGATDDEPPDEPVAAPERAGS
jgi:predicted PurR-regulated permease PerM